VELVADRLGVHISLPHIGNVGQGAEHVPDRLPTVPEIADQLLGGRYEVVVPELEPEHGRVPGEVAM
jgi:hypothetical protein